MRRVFLLLIVVIWSTYPVPAFSTIWGPNVLCYSGAWGTWEKKFGGFSPATIYVANRPFGAVLWRSGEISVSVTCLRQRVAESNDRGWLPIYISQYVEAGNADGLRPGFTYQGVDYVMSGLDDRFVKTPYMLGPNAGDHVTFDVTISINIQRRRGDVATSGYAWNMPYFPKVQVGALGTVEASGHRETATSFYITVENPGIKLTDCGADVRISKYMIDFGEISAFRAGGETIAKRVPFEISSNRSCPGKFKVNATLKPLTSNSYARGDFLVPSQNDSIGIRIRNQGNGEIFPFDQKKELADLTNSTSQTNRYLAEAVWQTGKPKLGRFEAAARLEIEYQ
ncbi:fimbrial protein [Burkholderia ubonensis]|uniref:fimbrial protein n=1 Tax=Burkholderia ubonensis TaxID=101571 RepID=UPI0009B41764|nr:fimbrial protein [Burkholderia ubonensis]